MEIAGELGAKVAVEAAMAIGVEAGKMSAMNSGLGIGREVGRVAGAQAAAVAAAKDLAKMNMAEITEVEKISLLLLKWIFSNFVSVENALLRTLLVIRKVLKIRIWVVPLVCLGSR